MAFVVAPLVGVALIAPLLNQPIPMKETREKIPCRMRHSISAAFDSVIGEVI